MSRRGAENEGFNPEISPVFLGSFVIAFPDPGKLKSFMTLDEFRTSLAQAEPPHELPAPLAVLWWDANGVWARAHAMVDDLETKDGMAVHAYLHRKEGVEWNAEYWYKRAGRKFHRPTLDAEWEALVAGLLKSSESAS